MPWCGERVQTPAEIQTQTCASTKILCMDATVNLRLSAGKERVCVFECLDNIISIYFFECVSLKSSLCDYTAD